MIQITWLVHCTKSGKSTKSGKTVGYILDEQVMLIVTTQGTSTALCVLDVGITCTKKGRTDLATEMDSIFKQNIYL